jgi:phage/plasmid-associated DNA primase
MDTVGAFIDERCIRDAAATVPPTKLYEEYKTWCNTRAEKPLQDFGTRLIEKGFQRERNKVGRFWRGLALQPVTGDSR